MSHLLISHSPDLKKLRDEGYEIEVNNSHLLIHEVPYVNAMKKIAKGVLVCLLTLAGDCVASPQDHTIYFAGEKPCDSDGNDLEGIVNSSEHKILAEGIEVDHYFSAKPISGNYENYFDKVVTYVSLLESHAQIIDQNITAKTFNVVALNDPDIVFHYPDTNSSRAEIDTISDKLKDLKVAIIGLGGTGSYVLDFVSKTPVREIHIFDGDDFLSHNSFRAPGCTSIDILREKPKKVAYLHNKYSKMHKYIIPHEYHIVSSTLDELTGMSFVFICIDQVEIKKLVIDMLIQSSIPFVDVGMGVNAIEGALTGSVRVTAVTADKNDHIDKRIAFSGGGDDDYDKNIQIAELNALNAALAVIKWKKLFGFYHDLGKEHNMVYDINVNGIINDEIIS